MDSIRESIRQTCFETKAKLDELFPARAVSTSEFLNVLHTANIQLSEDQLEVLFKRFKQPCGKIFSAQFLNFLAISPPADYIDPERFLAQLPQPYRMIVKVLETEIIDTAWNLIQQTETYRQKMKKLQNNISSTGIEDEEEAKRRKCEVSFDLGEINTPQSIVSTSDGKYLIVYDENLLLIDVENRVTLEAVPELSFTFHAMSEIVGATSGDLPLRIAIGGIKAETMSIVIQIYDLFETSTGCFNLVAELSQPLDENHIQSIKISPDGRVLVVSYTNGTGAMYSMPQRTTRGYLLPNQIQSHQVSGQSIDETAPVSGSPDAEDQQETTATLFSIETPILVFTIEEQEEDPETTGIHHEENALTFGKNEAIHVHFISIFTDCSSQDQITTTGFVVYRDGSPFLYKYSLLHASEKEMEHDVKVLVDQRKEWALPSSISAVEMNPGVFVTGLRDGNVIAWDMHLGIEYCTLERHTSPILSLALHQNRYLTSLSETGRMHFYDIVRKKQILQSLIRSVPESEIPRVSVKTDADIPICYVASEDRSINVYEMTTGRMVGVIEAADGQENLIWNSRGNALMICSRSKRRLCFYSIDQIICVIYPTIANWLAQGRNTNIVELAKQLVLAGEMTQGQSNLAHCPSTGSITSSQMSRYPPTKSTSTLGRSSSRLSTNSGLGMINSGSGTLLPSMTELPSVPPKLRAFDPSDRDPIQRGLMQQALVFDGTLGREAIFNKRRQVR